MCKHTFTHAHPYVYQYIYMYIYMHVCTYIHLYTYILFTACGPLKHQRVMSGRQEPGPTCTKHLNLRCSLSLTFTLVKIV